jgi:hypothetical protein
VRKHKICTVMSPTLARRGARSSPRSATQAAARERVDNVRVRPVRRAATPFPRAAVEVVKLWENGRTLKVKFLDGAPDVQAKVEAIAKEWEEVANLQLRFVTSGNADIRISFAEKGFSWSTVGTDATTVPRGEATMNYGWLEPSTSMREYQRVVRHEFGHALGMIHEHQNPAAADAIPWDKPKVYAYYAQQGWTQEDTDFNIFQTYDEDATNFTAFDPLSIMAYAIPDSLTVGSYSIGWNTALSDVDREFMGTQYPATVKPLQELVVGGSRVAADLASPGETDSYHLVVEDEATYILTTTGGTDTVLTLLGPDDASAVFAWDDDLGAGTNARLVRKLRSGEYWVTVRHQDPTGTGAYDVGVTRRKG